MSSWYILDNHSFFIRYVSCKYCLPVNELLDFLCLTSALFCAQCSAVWCCSSSLFPIHFSSILYQYRNDLTVGLIQMMISGLNCSWQTWKQPPYHQRVILPHPFQSSVLEKFSTSILKNNSSFLHLLSILWSLCFELFTFCKDSSLDMFLPFLL